MSRSNSTKRRHHKKPVEPLQSCPASGGKVRYGSRKRGLTAMNRLRSLNGTHLTAVYHCPHCRDWHLTSTPQRAA